MTPSPSPRAQEQKPVPAGFTLPLDIVVAPGRAFLKIAQTGEWLPALLVVVLLGSASTAIVVRPFMKILLLQKSSAPPLSTMNTAVVVALDNVVIPLLVAMLLATFLTVLMRFKDPAASYFRALSLALNCMVPTSLGDLLHSIVIVLRQPWSTSSFRAFGSALPDTLGEFAARGNEREFEFLVRFSVWDAWTFVLLGFGIALFTGMRFTTALVISASLYFLDVALYR